MTTDERLHYLGGCAKALPFRFCSRARRMERVRQIDLFGFWREWDQNLAGENPNIPMSSKQMAEARAWGDGARAVLGFRLLEPSRPPEYDLGYPLGYPWRTA